MKILLTGVHLTPALELIKQLKKDKTKWQIFYIGHLQTTNTHIKNTLIPLIGQKNIAFIPSGKFDRQRPLKTIQGIPKTFIGIIKSLQLLKKIKPSIVVSFGGYVSVPVVFASFLKQIKSITHDQTQTVSLSTKINSFFVTKIALSFSNPNQIKQLPKHKVEITGNLLRTDILNKNSSKKFTSLAKNKKPLLYITGGSQGSLIINQTIKKILPQLTSFKIIHQIGTINLSRFQPLSKKFPNYHPVEYVGPNDLGWIFYHAKIVISRAGANTCQELAVRNKNCVIIPIPNTSQNEQQKNALWLKSKNKNCHIIKQKQLTTSSLLKAIKSISNQPNLTIRKKITQNKKLLDLIHEII